MSERLDVDELAGRALGEAPVASLGPDDWQEALEVFVRSVNDDARLHRRGMAMAGATAVGRLRARMAIDRWYEHHPARVGARPEAPIFIIGGWRTGTTFLQRLLAASPTLRALHPWELGAPWKAAGADEQTRAQLIAAAQVGHDRLHELSPQLQVVHDSGADLPEECVLALGTTMRNWGFLSTMRLTGYADWLTGQDFGPEYEAYARVLAMLDDRDGRRFVLKAPAHTAELMSLIEAFPDATVVHLHRDVVETVASGSSLFAVFRSIYSDEVDPIDVGDFQARTTLLWFERAMAARDECERRGVGRFVDVAYTDFVADPLATARAVHEAADLGWNTTIEQALRERLDERATKPHGRHEYTPEQFGLDADEIRRRFSSYTQRFGVN
ncbi:MAG: sulfotransferase [Acidimicrobiales bacterium]